MDSQAHIMLSFLTACGQIEELLLSNTSCYM